jgi:hypothetical protein
MIKPCVCASPAAVACAVLACASQPTLTAGESAEKALTELSSAILADVPDQARAKEIVAVVQQLKKEDREARDTVAAYRERLHALNAKYDASEGDFRSLFADFNNERLMRQNHIAGLWITMAGLTTDREWRALSDARTTAAKALLTPD